MRAMDTKLRSLGIRPLNGRYGSSGADLVASLEASLDRSLPKEYSAFLKSFDRTSVFATTIVFHADQPSPWAEDGADTLEVLYANDEGRQNILGALKVYGDRLPSVLLPIGQAPGGNIICLHLGSNQVFFWDHEGPESPDEGASLFPIASSFSSFISMLKAEKEDDDAPRQTAIGPGRGSPELRKRIREFLATSRPPGKKS